MTDKLEKLPESREEAARLASESGFVRQYVPKACLEAYIDEKEV